MTNNNEAHRRKYLWITIAVVIIIIMILIPIRPKVEIHEKHTVDTVTIVKIDTIVKYKTKYIKERVVDTIYIERGGQTIEIPRIQRHFKENSLYDAWVSGYDPLIDSIKVYPTTEYTTITQTVTREVTPLTYKLYAGGGIQAISRNVAPYVSVTLATPKKWLFSAKLGIYDSKILVGGEVSYKILEK